MYSALQENKVVQYTYTQFPRNTVFEHTQTFTQLQSVAVMKDDLKKYVSYFKNMLLEPDG